MGTVGAKGEPRWRGECLKEGGGGGREEGEEKEGRGLAGQGSFHILGCGSVSVLALSL